VIDQNQDAFTCNWSRFKKTGWFKNWKKMLLQNGNY
jgi:hypothetical protein